MSDQKTQQDAHLEFGCSRYKFQLSAGVGREINLTVTPRDPLKPSADEDSDDNSTD